MTLAWKEYAELGVSGILLCFVCTVLACVVLQILNGKPAFTTGFFLLYVVQCVSDTSEYFVDKFNYYITVRAFFQGVFSPEVLLLVRSYSLYFQCWIHAAISLNRYVVMKDATRITATSITSWQGRSWRGCKYVRLSLISCVLLPLPGVFAVVYHAYVIVDNASLKLTLVQLQIVVFNAYNWTSAGLSFALDVGTIIRWRRLSPTLKQKHNEDLKLLAYAISQLVIQMVLTMTNTLLFLFPFGSSMFAIAAGAAQILHSVFCLSGALCLLITSKPLRKAYVNVYFALWPSQGASRSSDARRS